ncbi:MAG: non-canonical purine NTP pyrophosphatase, partial [Acidobacteriaceae bacterium]
VDALGGEPGVRSARFADDAGYVPRGSGPQPSLDARNILYLLSRMRGIALRTARYRCALALARDRKVLLTAEGFVDGEILTAPRGTGGFGYDPLFFLPQFRLTMAEISLEQKNAVSHRGRALRTLLPGLKKLIP